MLQELWRKADTVGLVRIEERTGQILVLHEVRFLRCKAVYPSVSEPPDYVNEKEEDRR